MGIIGTFEGWVSDTLVIYNGGSWNYVSNAGVTCTTGETNGLILYPYRYANGGGGTVIWYDAVVRLNSTFNITKYKYIKVSCTVGGEAQYTTVYVGVSSSQNMTNLGFTATATLNGSGTCISNISSISGDYYIYIGARSQYLYNYRPNVNINTIVVSTT